MDWGSSAWQWFHRLMASGIPEADKLAFIQTIPSQLPCKECVVHFRRILVESPPVSPAEEWLIMAHNKVNRRLGKRVLRMRHAKRLARQSTRTHTGASLVFGIALGVAITFVTLNGRKQPLQRIG